MQSLIFTSFLEDPSFKIHTQTTTHTLKKIKWLPTPSWLPFVSLDLLTSPSRFAIWPSCSQPTFHRSSCHSSKPTLLCFLHCLFLKNSQKTFTIIIFPPYTFNQTKIAITTDSLRRFSHRFRLYKYNIYTAVQISALCIPIVMLFPGNTLLTSACEILSHYFTWQASFVTSCRRAYSSNIANSAE